MTTAANPFVQAFAARSAIRQRQVSEPGHPSGKRHLRSTIAEFIEDYHQIGITKDL